MEGGTGEKQTGARGRSETPFGSVKDSEGLTRCLAGLDGQDEGRRRTGWGGCVDCCVPVGRSEQAKHGNDGWAPGCLVVCFQLGGREVQYDRWA
jgi:hypothetical protein